MVTPSTPGAAGGRRRHPGRQVLQAFLVSGADRLERARPAGAPWHLGAARARRGRVCRAEVIRSLARLSRARGVYAAGVVVLMLDTRMEPAVALGPLRGRCA